MPSDFRAQQASDTLDALDDPTLEDVSRMLDQFDADDVAAMISYKVKSAGGGGGSSPVKAVAVSFDFSSADLVSGITLYTPTPGDLIVVVGSIPVAWNGTTPGLWVGFDVADAWNNTGFDATQPDDRVVEGLFSLNGQFWDPPFLLTVSTPIKVGIQDGSGGSAGSTQGQARVILLAYPAQ
jgi:hypothetical protein